MNHTLRGQQQLPCLIPGLEEQPVVVEDLTVTASAPCSALKYEIGTWAVGQLTFENPPEPLELGPAAENTRFYILKGYRNQLGLWHRRRIRRLRNVLQAALLCCNVRILQFHPQLPQEHWRLVRRNPKHRQSRLETPLT